MESDPQWAARDPSPRPTLAPGSRTNTPYEAIVVPRLLSLMTDILVVIPDFSIQAFANLIPSLEKHRVSVTDILTCDATDIAKRAQVPVREVRRLSDALLISLHLQLGIQSASYVTQTLTTSACSLADRNKLVTSRWQTISILDDVLDTALGGGFPTGYLTEITGESGAGKTQLLLTLLLAVQLPPPSGLSRSAIYISTEAPLPTSRLSQLLLTHPRFAGLPSDEKPSLSRILALQTPDLESQDHIFRYQLPVAIARHNVALVVIDSITANYRAEFDVAEVRNDVGPTKKMRQHPLSMARRSARLLEVGVLLRSLARTHNIAIVVANQVSDRFIVSNSRDLSTRSAQSSQPTGVSVAADPRAHTTLLSLRETPSASAPATRDNERLFELKDRLQNPLTLDHQQRFFTGWGASFLSPEPLATNAGLKTPSLGLVWTNQIACRITLVKVASPYRAATKDEISRWRRYLKVVFAPWAAGETGHPGVEFVITPAGLCTLDK